ncbi:MAG: radical SAM family heme chaperone HemW [bacterium]
MMGLYCHIPFCVKKCPYCNFYSVPSQRLIPRFLKAIKMEAGLYKKKEIFADPAAEVPKFDTLYLGGGTPSIIAPELIGDLIRHLKGCFPFSEDAEITVEANPGDLTPEIVNSLLKSGVNRLNIGIQSFNPKNLFFLGRRHTAEEARASIKIARDAGVNNLGLDLIYGLPGQSGESWAMDLEQVIDLRPEHISCYQLTIEDGTLFGKSRKQGRLLPLSEDKEYGFFITTSKTLTQTGYHHYEISNFSRGRQYISRHNTKYWKHIPYLGLGPSAHSFIAGERYWNHKSVEKYCKAIEYGKLPIEGREKLTKDQVHLESLYIGFRTWDGLDLKSFKEGFGQDLTVDPPGMLSLLKEQGRVEIKDGRLKPTLQGMAVADALAIMLLPVCLI